MSSFVAKQAINHAVIILSVLFILSGCDADSSFYVEGTTTSSGDTSSGSGTGTGSGSGSGQFATRTDFSGIYGGRVGSFTSTYSRYARLFIASTGSGFFYNSMSEEQAWPDWGSQQFLAVSLGANKITTQNLLFNMDADGYSFDSTTNTPDPQDSGTANFAGNIGTSTTLENYANISGTSTSGPGYIGQMDNSFQMTRVTHDENLTISLQKLADFGPWLYSLHQTWGYAVNWVDIGHRWEITVDASGSFTVNVIEYATDSGCAVSNGAISLIDPNKNEFSISFDLACNDTQVNGSYSGVGHLATNPNLFGENYFMPFVVQMTTDSTKYISFLS